MFELVSFPSDVIDPVGPADCYGGSSAIGLVPGLDELKIHKLGVRSTLLNVSRKVTQTVFHLLKSLISQLTADEQQMDNLSIPRCPVYNVFGMAWYYFVVYWTMTSARRRLCVRGASRASK